MRTKDEILDDARQDVINPNYAGKESFWLEVRKLEVIIDIRDTLNSIRVAAEASKITIPDKY